jgi:adenine phosphoribosyltransferase
VHTEGEFVMLEILKNTLEESPIVKKGDYDYVVHPITDGVPEVKSELLREVVNEIKNHLLKDYDKIVAVEAMGLPLGAILSVELDKPLVIIRKKSYGLPGEVSVEQKTGYSKSKLFINGLDPEDKIIIVDDVLSTGGTLKALISVLNDMGVNIVDVIVVIEKGDNKDQVERETGMEIKTLIKLDVIDGKIVVSDVISED